MRNYLRNKLKCQKGQSLVETALVLPIVILLLCGIIDFGWIMSNTLIVENGSREGARLGAVAATESNFESQVRSRVYAVTPAYSHGGMSVSARLINTAGPGNGDVKVTVHYTFDLLTPLAQMIIGKQDYTAASTCIMKAE